MKDFFKDIVNKLKIKKKKTQGILNTISFSTGGISYFPFNNFFNLPFFALLPPFTAAENLKIAGDNAGRRRILTTLGRGTHITRNMCSQVGEKHFTSDMCFPGGGTYITSDMCFQGRGTHITSGMCCPGRGTDITRDMCFPTRCSVVVT